MPPDEHATESIRHPLTRALLVLTFTTGIVDAVSYLGLGRVFTANMTGNVVLLGFGIVGAAKLPVLAPLISLAAFLIGGVAGGLLAGLLEKRRPIHLSTALATEALFVTIAVLLVAIFDVRPGSAAGDAVIAVLAFAMGVRNATVRKIAVPDLTTTVLTMTLTGLAAESRLAGHSGKGTTRRTAAIVAMFTGALAGALMVKSSLVLPLIVAVALVLVAWLTYLPSAVRARSTAQR
ncbi:MAG TPA: YoaK family protein [Solirubrobacteraceae bacterium]|jgi:uncharacterized membrane protein YoaK (UPF0700 family)